MLASSGEGRGARDVRRQRGRVDTLFVAHAGVAALSGVLAILFPHVFEYVIVHHGETLRLFNATANDDQKIEHLVLRMYGGLILAQAWIVWRARTDADAPMRRALVQAYALAFGVTTLALLRAQLTEGGGLTAWNWLNIAMFTGLTAAYGWFAVYERISAFDLGKGSLA
jgi:hypothetical protein